MRMWKLLLLFGLWLFTQPVLAAYIDPGPVILVNTTTTQTQGKYWRNIVIGNNLFPTDAGAKSTYTLQSFARTAQASSPITLTAANNTTQEITPGASTFTVNLTACNGASMASKVFFITKADSGAGTVVITPNATNSDTVDGASTYTLTNQYDFVMISSDGANPGTWRVLTQFNKIASAAHNFLTGSTITGFTKAQPAFTDVSGTATMLQGGTGSSLATNNAVIITNTTTTMSSLTGTNQAMFFNGSSIPSVGLLPMTDGGTGANLATNNAIIITNSSTTMSSLTGTSGIVWFNGSSTPTTESTITAAQLPTNGNFVQRAAQSVTPITLAATDLTTQEITTGASTFTVNLTASNGSNMIHKIYAITKADSGAGTVVITPNATNSDKIDGATTYTLTNQYDYVVISNDGANPGTWRVISHFDKIASVAHNFLTSSTITGLTQAQPAFTDISGAATVAQMPSNGNFVQRAAQAVTPITLAATDLTTQEITTGASTFTVNLTAANGTNMANKIYAIKKVDSGAGTVLVTPNATNSDKVDGATTFTLTNQYDCLIISCDGANPGNWRILSKPGGGSGTVTSFSAGALSPLFTTSVATATTTPALTFTLSTAAANTVFGNATGSTAAPGYTTAPSVVSLSLSGAQALWEPSSTSTGLFGGKSSGDGGSNVFIGTPGSLAGVNATGAQNVCIGDSAGKNISSAGTNVFIGDRAGGTAALSTLSGGDNVGIGSQALAALNSIGGANIAIGSSALASATGGLNVAIGKQAGTSIVGGTSNTIIGTQVGASTLITGTNNVLIGTSSNIDTPASGTSNTIQIGAGSTAVISATGCGTPSTSTTTIAGNLTVTGALTLANVAAHTWFGNNSGSSATPAFFTNTQLTADLNLFTSSLQGLVPPSGGGTTNFLRADGTFATPTNTWTVNSTKTTSFTASSGNLYEVDCSAGNVVCTLPSPTAGQEILITIINAANNFTLSFSGSYTINGQAATSISGSNIGDTFNLFGLNSSANYGMK